MKKKRRISIDRFGKRALMPALALFVSLSVAPALGVSAASQDTALVSPALCVLAQQNSMAKAGVVGNSIKFESDDFARAMNLSEISSVTITKAPPITDGELRLGSTVVAKGQTIRESNLSLLSYVPSSSNVSESSFGFSVNGSPLEMTCKLYMLDEVNYSPTLSTVSENYLNVSTHKNITLYGTLPCYDPDGDETVIEIVSYPETGILTLTDRSTGEYTFTPSQGRTGEDSFVYVARDIYGNYSASATVSLSVEKPSTSIVYADMENSPQYNAALTVTEKGIMSGTQVGSSVYFYPDRAVSRGEFLVMAMNAKGINEVFDSAKTVFADDASFSDDMRDYIAAAYELGYIQGEINEKGERCFYPDRTITRAEAAVMLSNILDAATPTVKPMFEDSSDIPAWASSSVYAMNHMGIMTATGGNISSTSTLTRGDAAQLLSALISVTEK